MSLVSLLIVSEPPSASLEPAAKTNDQFLSYLDDVIGIFSAPTAIPTLDRSQAIYRPAC
ncbi:hypothetical protein PGTUg99_022603 [Puccinia graminis f. sp. tritici]|uniref:Uncharacterized protein n=1 Tax=Puccinia graminis f. sp. tritici TaxID=56615 RepID=A0A5B0RY22_PUCGR|nr:hypothetical protein PGTUg99_022603 [Puccinia graminis f. sp. tritici]